MTKSQRELRKAANIEIKRSLDAFQADYLDALREHFKDEIAANQKNLAAVALGRLGGKRTSPAKAASSRKNGKKGGRPRGAKK